MNRIGFAYCRPQVVFHRNETFRVYSQDLHRGHIAGPQLAAELPNQLCPALSKLLKVHLKLSDEGASRTIGRKLPVFLTANIELDIGSAHLTFTNPEICG
jgi:hypothetical protein